MPLLTGRRRARGRRLPSPPTAHQEGPRCLAPPTPTTRSSPTCGKAFCGAASTTATTTTCATATRGRARELWQALGRIGALGVGIPEEHGGGGAGIEALAVVAEAVAEAGSPIMLLALSPAVCATVLGRFGSDRQRAEWLPGLADGSKVLGFAITEPDAGSNSHNIRTKARREGEEWVLSGQKYYVSHVDNADALLVVARAEDAELKAFLVPTDAPGIHDQPHRGRDRLPGTPVLRLLRRRPGARRRGGRPRRRSGRPVRRPQPRAHRERRTC